MQTKYPVKPLCQAHFAALESGAASLDQFFRLTLGLSDCSWSDLVNEVKYLKGASCTDFDRINGLYTLINKSIDRTKVDDIKRLRSDYFIRAECTCRIFANSIPGEQLTKMP